MDDGTISVVGWSDSGISGNKTAAGFGQTDIWVVSLANAQDSIPPVITLLGDNPLIHECGVEFVDPGATAWDETDGDLSNSIVVEGLVDSAIPGSYTLTYTVDDGKDSVVGQSIPSGKLMMSFTT